MILIYGQLIITVTWLTLADVIFSTWFLAMQAYRWYCTRYYPTLDMIYLMHDLWHRHLIYYIWYPIHDTWYLTPALDILYLLPDPRHLILDTDTWYMSYLSLDLDPRYMTHANSYLTCFHVIQVHWLDIVTLDRTHPWYMYYMAYSWLSLLRGLGMIIILLSLIHIWRCRRSTLCRSRWSPYH